MPTTYEYHRPGDLNEACRLLADLPQARVLAGGTDLLFDIESGLRQARHMVSIQEIDELRRIEETDNHVSIGAGCTAREVKSSKLIRFLFREIAEMVVTFASPQIRTRATIAGNICSAVPCGDFPVILIALGAQVELVSTRGIRAVPLRDFFTGPRETLLEEDELLARVLIPKKQSGSGGCYLKYQRRASHSLAVASVAAFLDVQEGVCRDARIVLGAVAPTPMVAEKAGASLVGHKVDAKNIARAGQLARDEARPIADVRGTMDFRRELVGVLAQRALRLVADRL